ARNSVGKPAVAFIWPRTQRTRRAVLHTGTPAPPFAATRSTPSSRKERPMRQHSQSGNNSDSTKGRSRGAIRTHLGRKRTGPRRRDAAGPDAFERRHQEDLFEKMRARFDELLAQAGETTLAAIDGALDTAFDALVAAGEFTAESGERVRQWLKRDALHRGNP